MMLSQKTKLAAVKSSLSLLALQISATFAVLCAAGCSSSPNSDHPEERAKTTIESVPDLESLPKDYTDMARLLTDGPYLSK
jgi:hypothetical protein